MNGTKRRFKIETFDYGTFYRFAKTPALAKKCVIFAIYGRAYCGWEADYWEVTEVA